MSRIVRDQYHSSNKTKTQGGRWWCWGWRDINFTDRAMEEVDTTFKSDSAPFSTMHVAQMALHTMRCNIDGYIGGNGARAPSHLNLHQSVHQRKRASTKNQIGVNSSVELTLAPGVIIVMEGDGCSSCWCRGLCLWLVHKTHHLAPHKLTSLKPIRPTTVFTRIGFHQRCNARKWSTYGWCFLIFSEKWIGQWAQ